MFKHTVQYVDFNGQERKDDLYFHLASHEVIRLEAEIGKSLETYINELQINNKLDELLKFLERVFLNSYGEKTSDGKSFYKSKAIREAFEYSVAYAELFEEVVNNPELAKKFGQNVAEKNKATKNQVAPTVVSD